MKNKFILILAFLLILFLLTGCTKNQQKETQEKADEQTENSIDTSDVDNLEKDLDNSDVDNFDKDLENIDW